MNTPCIAVATDFSPRADRAVDRAKFLQEQIGAKLCIIHATNLAVDDVPDAVDLERQMRSATGFKGTEGNVDFLFPHGSPPKAISNACEDRDASLLVIGPARYNSLGDYFLGTAVDYVLRRTTRPVLVVKQRANGPYSQIVAGTDFSPGAAHAIVTAARMFPDVGMHIVHSWHIPFQAWNRDAYVADEVEREARRDMDRFKESLVEREPSLADATTELVKGGAVDAIKKGLELDPSALVVIGSHGASGFRQASVGSVTSDLLRFIAADTLVVNAKDAQ